MKDYIVNILISLDQLLNTLFLGSPDETVSSRCGKRVGKCKFCTLLCKILNKIDKRHCKKSIEWDEGESNEHA